MSVPVKTLPHNHYAVVRVVRLLTIDNETHYYVERRHRWWPVWRRSSKAYNTQEDAVAVAEAHLLVMDYIQRTVHEPHVVWRG